MQIEYATGDDLDSIWGEVYELPRRTAETDDSYRDRLKNYTNTLIGCGTKANCQAIVDHVTGYVGSCEMTSYYPANVRIEFNDDMAARAAYEKSSLLNLMIPQMLAGGVTYDLLFQYTDLLMTTRMFGPSEEQYWMRAWITQNNKNLIYLMRMAVWSMSDCPLSIDALARTTFSLDWYEDVLVRTQFSTYMLLDSLMQDAKTKTYTLDTYLETLMTKLYWLNTEVIKRDLLKSWYSDTLVKRARPRMFALSCVVFLPHKDFEIGVLIV